MGGVCGSQASIRDAAPTVSILLLGGANVGKSTIFKQMRILYKDGFEATDREWAKGCIIENILEALIDLDSATDAYGVEVLGENEDLVDELKPFLLQMKVRDPMKPVKNINEIPWDSIERLWRDPGIQAVFQEVLHPTGKVGTTGGSEKVLPVSSGYFLKQLDRIKRDTYVPSDDDILHLRRSTSDSDTISYRMEVTSLIGKPTPLNVKCTDVGGQAHERTEWAKHSENLNAILYIMSLPEYSNVTSTGNALQKQLDILELVKQTECFANTTIIVLLNKFDLLEAKLQGLHVNEYFPDYQGNNDLESVLEFFRGKVKQALGIDQTEEGEATEQANIITSCATDTQLMRTIIEAVGQSILQKTLSEAKFFG